MTRQIRFIDHIIETKEFGKQHISEERFQTPNTSSSFNKTSK